MDPGLTVEEPPPTEEQPADSSGDPGRPPPRRRLPRTPPPRTGFTGASEEDSTKRRHWWDEIFSDDFLRAEFELTESQFLDEVNFIQESLAVEKGGLVLDLACGNGRHAIELTRRGYTVVGYDLSLSQLARAGERAQRSGVKVSLLHGDMRELAFEPTFDGIFCWNAGFGYFEEEKNQAVLRNVFRALKPGGTFLLDIPNRDFVVSQQPNQNWFEGDGCVCMDDMQVDFITSRLVVKRTIMLDDGRNRECTFSIRLYGLHELGRILHEAGFRVAEVTGHIAMRGVFMGATSPRLILVVIKP
jgi:SAM-dependent methyltransferase